MISLTNKWNTWRQILFRRIYWSNNLMRLVLFFIVPSIQTSQINRICIIYTRLSIGIRRNKTIRCLFLFVGGFCPGDHQLINECDFLLDAPEPPSNCCSLIELNGATIPINANPNWSVSFGQINQREIKEEDERPIMCPREFLCDFKSFFFRRIFIGSAEFKRWYFKCVLDREIKIHSCRFSLWEILCRNGWLMVRSDRHRTQKLHTCDSPTGQWKYHIYHKGNMTI